MGRTHADQLRHRRRVGGTDRGYLEHNKREQRRRRTERQVFRQMGEMVDTIPQPTGEFVNLFEKYVDNE